MLTHVAIRNYRSFVDTEVGLSPFTLVVGANASGKTNFLRLFKDLNTCRHGGFDPKDGGHPHDRLNLLPHYNCLDLPSKISLQFVDGTEVNTDGRTMEAKLPWRPLTIPIFSIDPDVVASPEKIITYPVVLSNGAGTVQVLDALKTGDREEQFNEIVRLMREFVPEIERISLVNAGEGVKAIQVREKGLKDPTPVKFLSFGTRTLLALVTATCQDTPPGMLLIEDIDRGLHPRLLERLVETLQALAKTKGVQVIATTHNPYLVDCFRDEPEAVVIVEKKGAASELSTLAQRMEGLDYDKIDPNDMPLGNLWFSGFVGGVPATPQDRSAR